MYSLSLTHQNPVVTGLKMNTVEEKRIAYNAVAKQTGKVQDLIGNIVDVSNFHCSLHNYQDEETGEVTEYVKTILILSDGSTYYAKSKLLFLSLADFVSVFGMPDEWGGNARMKLVMNGKGYAIEFIDFV